MDTLYVKKFESHAFMPRKGRQGDAGWDLSSAEDTIIPGKSWKLIDTGIGITVPNGTYGRIAPRSGVSTKGISVNAGVIDKTYTGRVKVLLINHGETDFSINVGDRIAQLLLEKIIDECDVIQVEELENSVRGDGGFGSSGK
jgi:dUTP pyrophosphatase